MTATATAIDPSTSRLMDALRGGSSLVVALAHVVQVFVLPYFGYPSALGTAMSLTATYAVMIFFVVSGFMIAHSAVRHRRNEGFCSTAFLAARVIRIYPPLLVAILLTAIVYGLIVGLNLHGAESYRLANDLWVTRERATFEWEKLPQTLLLIYGVLPGFDDSLLLNGPLWTLSYEFWFYLIALAACHVLWNRGWVIGGAPLAVLVGIVIYSDNQLFQTFFMVWALGAALAVAYQSRSLNRLTGRGVAFSVLLIIAAVVTAGGDGLSLRLSEPYNSRSGLVILWLIFVSVTLALGWIIGRGLGRRRAGYGWMARLAPFSYSLYLFHFPVLMLGFSLTHQGLQGHPWPVALVVGIGWLAVALALSAWVARYVEDRDRIRRAFAFARRAGPSAARAS